MKTTKKKYTLQFKMNACRHLVCFLQFNDIFINSKIKKLEKKPIKINMKVSDGLLLCFVFTHKPLFFFKCSIYWPMSVTSLNAFSLNFAVPKVEQCLVIILLLRINKGAFDGRKHSLYHWQLICCTPFRRIWQGKAKRKKKNHTHTTTHFVC